MDALLATVIAADRAWTDIPGVRLFGAIVGIVIVVAAIRAMFRK